MMSTEPIIESLHEIVGDLEIPCEYAGKFRCGPAAARWVMTVRCQKCQHTAHRLACGGCKNIWLATEDAVRCPSCEDIHSPARRAFVRVEWLK